MLQTITQYVIIDSSFCSNSIANSEYALGSEIVWWHRCWYAYTKESYYWILEGPRVLIIAVRVISSSDYIR